jgi:hypothetical protein
MKNSVYNSDYICLRILTELSVKPSHVWNINPNSSNTHYETTLSAIETLLLNCLMKEIQLEDGTNYAITYKGLWQLHVWENSE